MLWLLKEMEGGPGAAVLIIRDGVGEENKRLLDWTVEGKLTMIQLSIIIYYDLLYIDLITSNKTYKLINIR